MQPDRILEPNPEAEDEAYDAARQREVDAETEARMKRNASGTSPEALELQDALLDGMRAGERGSAAGLNPHPVGSPKHAEWLRGHRSVSARKLAADLRRRAAMRPCEPCTCGGRGLCRDAA